jgi:glycosyltransferase involved in cell wall biosynthesis
MLSVVIPNFNHGAFLRASLEAVLAQLRAADEIIVIDDASTDDSLAVVSSFLDRHPNLRLVQNARNLGCVRSLNRGLELARGSIVYFGAADDLTYPSLFARAVVLLEAYPDAALFSARSDLIDADGKRLGAMPTPVALRAPGFLDRAAAARFLMREDGWFMGNTTIYRRAALLAIGGFPEDLQSFTDGYVSRLLALRHGACYSPEVLAAWRRLAGGFAWSQTVDRSQLTDLIAIATRRMTEEGSPFPPGYAERWRGRYFFGARRFGLTEARRRAAARGTAAHVLAAAREIVVTAWLFFRLRPRDILSVARRQLGYLIERTLSLVQRLAAHPVSSRQPSNPASLARR